WSSSTVQATFFTCVVSGSGHPSVPRPFPTRRSSDLAASDHRGRAGAGGRHHVAHRRHPRGAARPAAAAACSATRVPPMSDMVPRSEEHTSELQSQSKLVCRLLLEKKKKQNKQKRLYT